MKAHTTCRSIADSSSTTLMQHSAVLTRPHRPTSTTNQLIRKSSCRISRNSLRRCHRLCQPARAALCTMYALHNHLPGLGSGLGLPPTPGLGLGLKLGLGLPSQSRARGTVRVAIQSRAMARARIRHRVTSQSGLGLGLGLPPNLQLPSVEPLDRQGLNRDANDALSHKKPATNTH